jgi:hypothetical protein
MGTAAFERDSVVEINGEKYRMLRKVSDTCWQLVHSKTARISDVTSLVFSLLHKQDSSN